MSVRDKNRSGAKPAHFPVRIAHPFFEYHREREFKSAIYFNNAVTAVQYFFVCMKQRNIMCGMPWSIYNPPVRKTIQGVAVVNRIVRTGNSLTEYPVDSCSLFCSNYLGHQTVQNMLKPPGN